MWLVASHIDNKDELQSVLLEQFAIVGPTAATHPILTLELDHKKVTNVPVVRLHFSFPAIWIQSES